MMRQTSKDIRGVKKAVRDRDCFCCVYCSMSNESHIQRYGKQLDVHRETPGSVYTVAGCVTVCKVCHGRQPKREGGTDLAYGPPTDGMRNFVPGFAERLKAARERFPMSQQELADAASTHPDSIVKLENGVRQPSLELAWRLATALGVTVQDFLPKTRKGGAK